MVASAYAKDGVDIEVGDDFSAFAGAVCRSTFKSRFVSVKDYATGSFRGPRAYRFRNLPHNVRFDSSADGVGTKVGVITAALSHRTAGHDLIAMTASDISRYGGLPLLALDLLDVSTLGKPGDKTYAQFCELMLGLGDACRTAGIVLWRGETAELGPYVGSENPQALTKFNWAGFVTGAYHPNRVITGNGLRAGQVVMSLRERGFRSNGLSSVRTALANKFGPAWWANESPEAKLAIEEAAVPSTLYDKLLARLNGWYDQKFRPVVDIKAIAHLSGGGIPGKFAEDILFPQGLSARLDTLWEPPPVMQQCLAWHGQMSEREAYRVWNGGQGMLVVIDPKDETTFLGYAKASGIEAKRAGHLYASDRAPLLVIRSGYSGDALVYEPKTA